MENNQQLIQCSISYQVDIDENSPKYEKVKKGLFDPTPFDFRHKSPIIARNRAFKLVNVSNRPITASDLNVFFVYEKTGRKYQIFRGQGMTDEILRNLNIEHILYEEGGYPYRVSTVLADSNENAYQAILSPSQKGYTKLRKLSWYFRSVAPNFHHDNLRIQLPDN